MTTTQDITLKFENLEALDQFEDLNQEMAQCVASLKLLFQQISNSVDAFSEAALLATLGETSIDGWQINLDKRTALLWDIARDLRAAQKAA